MIITLFASLNLQAAIHAEVIYNSDERKEINDELPQDTMQFVKKRMLAIVNNARLFPQQTGEVIFMPRVYGSAHKLCKDERFYDQPSLPDCTASVVGKDLVLTAGHCISEDSCRFLKFVADYEMIDGKAPYKTMPDKIYACKKVLFDGGNNGDENDIALVQLDREFPYSALHFAEKSMTLQDQILAIGFPSGLPLKSSGAGPIRTVNEKLINAELETFGGNSGSPVFKKDSDEIVGVLVAGEDDFILADNKRCYKTKICDSNTCIGESVVASPWIQKMLESVMK